MARLVGVFSLDGREVRLPPGAVVTAAELSSILARMAAVVARMEALRVEMAIRKEKLQ